MGRSTVLSSNVTSRPVTALINVTETVIFCSRYLKINNSTVKKIYKEIFFSHIYSETSTRNFVRMHWDLELLSNIVCGLLYSRMQCTLRVYISCSKGVRSLWNVPRSRDVLCASPVNWRICCFLFQPKKKRQKGYTAYMLWCGTQRLKLMSVNPGIGLSCWVLLCTVFIWAVAFSS